MTDTTVITTSPANTNNAGTMLSEIRVSLLNSFFDTTPMQIRLPEVMDVVNSNKLKEQTEIIRRNRQIQYDEQQSAPTRMQAKEVADKVKKQTPVIMPNVVMDGGKKRENIKRFLPLIAFDIDHISEDETIQLMAEMKKDPHMVFGQPSSSRRGVHGLLHIDAADFLNQHWDGMHTDAYDYVWEYVRLYTKTQFDRDIDTKCKNTEHTLALCYDELTFMNLEAVPLHIDVSEFSPRTERKSNSKSTKKSIKKSKVCIKLADVLNDILIELDNRDVTFDEGQRNAYIYQFAAICNDYGVDQQEVVDYCLGEYEDDDFNEQEIISTIHSAYKKEEQHGTRKQKRHKANYDELMELINNYGEWRYNELTLEYEVIPKGAKQWRSRCDEDHNELVRRALEQNIVAGVKNFEVVINSFQTRRINPIMEYLSSLPKGTLLPDGRFLIDGQSEPIDYIGQMAGRLHTTSTPDDVCYYFKKWFVQMVKCWIDKNITNEIVLGLLGKQGIFKTTYFKFLIPPHLRNKYFDVKTTNGVFDKDENIKMCNHLLYLQEELDEMTAKELNQFKATVSQTNINVRVPYGHYPINAHKTCSFAFTGNHREILNDSTGNRRFVPFWVESIDNPYDNPINYDALYAQAYALAQPESGFTSYIPSKEIDQLNKRNQEFCVPEIEAELIDRYISAPTETSYGEWMAPSIILAYLQQQNVKAVLSVRKVIACLRKLGIPEKRVKQGLVFRIIRRSTTEIEGRSKMEPEL